MLLDFWATWCPPCLEEIPMLGDLHARLAGSGFTVLGAAADEADPQDLADFAREWGIGYPVVHVGPDPLEGFPVLGLPTAYLIDRDGRVVKRYFGSKSAEELERDVRLYLDPGRS